MREQTGVGRAERDHGVGDEGQVKVPPDLALKYHFTARIFIRQLSCGFWEGAM